MSPSRRRGFRVAAAVAASGLIAASAFAVTAGASAAPSATGPFVGSVGGSSTTALTSYEDGRYVVTLATPSTATYTGGISGYAATKPAAGAQLRATSDAVESYSSYLADEQQSVAASVGASIEDSYTLALNGFSASLTAEQASKLAADRSVANVRPVENYKIDAVSSTEFLGLGGSDGTGGVWDEVGGVENAGKGVVVGVIDTGIAPENPSFAGDELGTEAGSDPYWADVVNPTTGDTEQRIVFDKSDGSTFTGSCQTGEQFTLADCSTKIVGAWASELSPAEISQLGTAANGEYRSPRDGDGHGSHTASTAAGNFGVDASVAGRDFGTISGVAPAAKVAAYKVCWSGPDNSTTDDDFCSGTGILQAIDQAVADGVDVINFSIGGGAATSTVTATDEAFLGAAAAGVFVAVSAGNSGPGATTLDHASPWYTTVAASTIPGYEATATLGDGAEFAGASTSVTDTFTAPLVSATDAAADGVADAILCGPNSLDPSKVKDKIVFCERGGYDRVAKSAEVKRAGGVGVLLVNKTTSSVDPDAHSVPTIHLDADAYEAVAAYAETEDPTVTFTDGNLTGVTPPTPQIAGFSSRGPAEADGSNILKPDVAAPGVAILADGPNAAGAEPTYQFLSGTSMASPHVAGLGALYLGKFPNASPGEIKSVMMTTAYDTVDAEGEKSEDVFAQGAGHVDPTKFFAPGLVYNNGLTDWLGYIEGIGYEVNGYDGPAIDPSDLNIASIAVGALTGSKTVTRSVTSTEAGTFEASLDIPGVTTTVTPSTLTFGSAGETKEFTVEFVSDGAELSEFATGYLTWTSGDTEVRSPVAVRPVLIDAPAEVEGEGVTGSVSVDVTPGTTDEIPLTAVGLAKGELATDDASPEGHTGSGPTGSSFETTYEVPGDLTVARFDLDSLDDTADLDLLISVYDANGELLGTADSATGSADEQVTLVAPPGGTYAVTVDVFATGTAGDETTYDLTTYFVGDDGSGDFGTTPAALDAEQSVATTYDAAWTGLDALSTYLGIVFYGESDTATLVSVTTQEASTPTPTATPTGTPTATPTPTLTPTATPTASPTSTADPAPTTDPTSKPTSTPAPGLASTGFDNAWLVPIAGVIIVAGIAVMVIVALRRRKAEQS